MIMRGGGRHLTPKFQITASAAPLPAGWNPQPGPTHPDHSAALPRCAFPTHSPLLALSWPDPHADQKGGKGTKQTYSAMTYQSKHSLGIIQFKNWNVYPANPLSFLSNRLPLTSTKVTMNLTSVISTLVLMNFTSYIHLFQLL